MTFVAVDATTADAAGEDPDSHQPVFTTTLLRSDQKELLDALAWNVNDDIKSTTVVIPDKGDDGPGPKMKFSLKLGPAK